MRHKVCLVAVLCLLPFPLGAVSMPPYGDGQRQMSAVPGPEPEQPTRGSNSSDTDEGGEFLRASLLGKGKQDGKPVYALHEHKAKLSEVESSENVPARKVVSLFTPDVDHSTGRLLVAVARTLVTTTASTTTVVVLSTCFGGTPAALLLLQACTGKRRRRLIALPVENSETELDSSIGSGSVLVNKLNERAGRFILWSSSITTVTIRTTSTNTLISVVALFLCSAPGLAACAG